MGDGRDVRLELRLAICPDRSCRVVPGPGFRSQSYTLNVLSGGEISRRRRPEPLRPIFAGEPVVRPKVGPEAPQASQTGYGDTLRMTKFTNGARDQQIGTNKSAPRLGLWVVPTKTSVLVCHPRSGGRVSSSLEKDGPSDRLAAARRAWKTVLRAPAWTVYRYII